MADPRLRLSGIYAIRNTVSGRVYVGSGVNIGNRWKAHRSLLNGGDHHSVVLQRSWDKHGSEAFAFEILELVENSSDLIRREQHWIDKLSAADPHKGFNRSPTAGSSLGIVHPPDVRAKFSAIRKGIPKSPEHRAAIGAAQVGKVISEAQRLLASEATRRYFEENPEARERQREVGRRNGLASKGRVLSAEARANISAARRRNPEFIAISIANLANIDPEKQKAAAAERGLRMRGIPNRKNRTMTYEQAQEIRALKADGWTYDMLEDKFGIGRAPLFRIVKGITYAAP